MREEKGYLSSSDDPVHKEILITIYQQAVPGFSERLIFDISL